MASNRDKDNLKSWIVLTAVTFSLFLEIGTIKCFSVLLMVLKEQFVTSTWVVGSCISIISGCGYILGVTSGAIVNMLSPRLAMMLSGLLASFGLIVCSLAPNTGILLIGLIITGFLLVQENIAIGLIPLYFDKYYETAVGIYSCGTGLGIIVMPIIAQNFLTTYGWRGTLLLLSGLGLQSIPCGALLIERTHSQEPKLNGRCRQTSEEGVKSESKLLFNLRCMQPFLEDQTSDTEPLLNTRRRQKFSAIRILKTLLREVGCQLLTETNFISRVLVPGFSLGYILTGWMIYIVTFAMSKDASIKEGSIVATFGGIGVTLSRIAVPLLHRIMTYKQLLYLSSLISAIALSIIPHFSSFTGMCFIVTISGIGVGLLGAEVYISAKVNCKESEHFHAIAWTHLFYGIAALLSGFLTGFLYDLTGSFSLSFYVLGAVALITALSLALRDICLGHEES